MGGESKWEKTWRKHGGWKVWKSQRPNNGLGFLLSVLFRFNKRSRINKTQKHRHRQNQVEH